MNNEAPATRPERKATMRLGQRELNCISLAVILLVTGSAVAVAIRIFGNMHSLRDIQITDENMHTLYKAMQRYADDWDSRLPPAENWMEAVRGYLSSPPGKPGGVNAYLSGSGDGGRVGYVYNELAAGYNLQPAGRDDRQQSVPPGKLVLLIERPDAPPNAHTRIPPQLDAASEQALFKELAFPHFADDSQNATTVILFADGSTRRLFRRDLASQFR